MSAGTVRPESTDPGTSDAGTHGAGDDWVVAPALAGGRVVDVVETAVPGLADDAAARGPEPESLQAVRTASASSATAPGANRRVTSSAGSPRPRRASGLRPG